MVVIHRLHQILEPFMLRRQVRGCMRVCLVQAGGRAGGRACWLVIYRLQNKAGVQEGRRPLTPCPVPLQP